jgi:hypothetical protein
MSTAYSGDTDPDPAPWARRRGPGPDGDQEANPVGFFKDIKSTLGSATEAAKASKQMQAEMQGIQSGEVGWDPNDPAFAPIEGIDCDTYARIMGGLGKNQVMGPENVEEYVTSNGVPPGRWGDISIGWTQRMQQYPHVANRIGTLMSQASM